MSKMAAVSDDWRDKVSILIYLLEVFPSRQSDLCDAIINVMTCNP